MYIFFCKILGVQELYVNDIFCIYNKKDMHITNKYPVLSLQWNEENNQ